MSVQTQQDLELWFRDDNLVTLTAESTTSIAGWTIAVEFLYRGAVDADLTKSCTITDAAAGVFTFTLNGDEDGFGARRTYTYEVRRTDNGAEATLAWGELIFQT